MNYFNLPLSSYSSFLLHICLLASCRVVLKVQFNILQYFFPHVQWKETLLPSFPLLPALPPEMFMPSSSLSRSPADFCRGWNNSICGFAAVCQILQPAAELALVTILDVTAQKKCYLNYESFKKGGVDAPNREGVASLTEWHLSLARLI